MVNEALILNASLYKFNLTNFMEAEYSANIIIYNIVIMAQDERVVQCHG